MNPQSPFYANYDEARANPFPDLPDALNLNNGKKVATGAMWWEFRRPEIVELFNREIYGRVPAVTPKVNSEVTSTKLDTNGTIPVITKKLVGHVDDSADTGITVNIELTLSMAAAATGPVPVMMQFGFNFPPGFLPDSAAPMHPLARTLRRRAITRRPGSSRCLRGAEGYAVLIPNRVQDENSAGLTTDFIGLCNRRQRRSRMTGGLYGPGPGVPAMPGIILKQTRRWMLCAAPRLYHLRRNAGRRLGGCQRDAHGRRRAGIPVAGKTRSGHHKFPVDGHVIDCWRNCLSPAHRGNTDDPNWPTFLQFAARYIPVVPDATK